jgi:hypothetical protein
LFRKSLAQVDANLNVLANAAELSCLAWRREPKEEIMKVVRFVLSIAVLTVCAVAYGQSPVQPVDRSDAQKSFDLMKTLAGNWQGAVTTDDPAWATDKPMLLSIRVASHGNALIHELNTGGPELTVFYLDSDRLTLLHYCDFGNRPHLVARPAADGKTVEFDLIDAPGSNQVGHVTHAVFTMMDADHHIEDWTFARANGRIVHGHVDFKRVQ